jgi:hypothetical protein
MRPMKWWGWGDEGVAFTHDDKPDLGPFIKRAIDLDVNEPAAQPVAFAELDVPEPALDADLRAALEAAVGPAHVSTDRLDRVVHARGKSLRDLVRHRRGDLGRLPDVVVRPGAEADVEAVMRAVLEADAVAIPFGGGTNISGSLEAPEGEERTVVSVDMARMDRVLAIDDGSRLARVQAGALGPELERQLGARGWTIGHFPDSFSHSRAASGSSPRRPSTCTASPSGARSSATCSPTGRARSPRCRRSPRATPRRRSPACRTPPRPRSRSRPRRRRRRSTARSRRACSCSSSASRASATSATCACRSSGSRAARTTSPGSAS